MSCTYLDDILSWHRQRVAHDDRDIDELVAACMSVEPPRGFAARIQSAPHLAVIAEIKRRSPSKGSLHIDLDAEKFATMYQSGGATCVSVLTDEVHFGGSVADLRSARSACSLPVIRKDFTVDLRDVCDARIMGADCVLLIAAALSAGEMKSFLAMAKMVDIDALVEVHDEAELDVALGAGATMIGVNQRDLVTFEVDQKRAVRMGEQIPRDVVRVAESGVRGRRDAEALRAAGYHAVLVGELLVTSPDPVAALVDLCVE